jgi:hypothetical protein
VWSWRRARWRVLRALGKGVRGLRPRARVLGLAGALAATLALVIAGIASARAPLPALQVGNGLRGGASVEARTPGGTWQRCSYSAVRGAYRCARLALVQDELGDLLNDAPPSPPFAVPVVTITPLTDRVEVRIGLGGQLRGEYWAATSEGKVELELPGQAALTLTQKQSAHEFSDDPVDQITLRATVAKRALKVALVRRDRIEPSRHYPAPPPAPPAQ